MSRKKAKYKYFFYIFSQINPAQFNGGQQMSIDKLVSSHWSSSNHTELGINCLVCRKIPSIIFLQNGFGPWKQVENCILLAKNESTKHHSFIHAYQLKCVFSSTLQTCIKILFLFSLLTLTHWTLRDVAVLVRNKIYRCNIQSSSYCTCFEIIQRQIPQNLTANMSTMVQVMACCYCCYYAT